LVIAAAAAAKLPLEVEESGVRGSAVLQERGANVGAHHRDRLCAETAWKQARSIKCQRTSAELPLANDVAD
jgi:hypothetical protein